MFLLMLIAPLGWNFKMKCLSILIAKMGFIIWFITELSEAVIEIYTSYSFSISLVCLFFVFRINPMAASGKLICLSHQYINKMTSFVDLLTIALLFCSQWLDETIHFCIACICFHKFTQSVCYNWSKTVFKGTSIIRSSTLIFYPCLHIISYCAQGLEPIISEDHS